MPLLQPSEYDASYFDGKLQTVSHNAGYSQYKRFVFSKEENGSLIETNNFKDIGLDILNRYTVGNKQVLDIGCAKGFLVQDLVEFGIDAYGVDVSPYAISQADPLILPRLTVGDIRVLIDTYRKNEWELLISMNMLCCFSDADLNILIPKLNDKSRDQFHLVSENANTDFYNPRTIAQWIADFPWAQGTVIANINGDFQVK